MRKLLIAALMAVMVMPAAAQIKLGSVNSQEIMLLMPETEQAQTEIENYQKELGAQLSTMEQEYQKKYQEYVDKQATATNLVKQQMERDIFDLQNKIEAFSQAAQADIQEAWIRLMTPIREKISKSVSDAAQRHAITVVYDSSQPPFVYVKESDVYDLTPDVKRALNLEGRKIPANLMNSQMQ